MEKTSVGLVDCYVHPSSYFVSLRCHSTSKLTSCSYNSVVFPLTSANEYAAFAVTRPFLKGRPFNTASSNGVESIAHELQVNASQGKLRRLGRSDCISIYSNNFLGQYSNVLLVTDLNEQAWSPSTSSFGNSSNRASGSAFDYFVHYPNPPEDLLSYQDINWQCDGTAGSIAPCTNNTNLWLFEYCLSQPCLAGTFNASVQYCLAQEVPQSCMIEMSLEILIVVIISNGLKALCFMFAVRKKGFEPLVTLGDAVSSFLSDPDPHTSRCGALSADAVYNKILFPGGRKYRLSLLRESGSRWKNVRVRWFWGASPYRWVSTIML